MDIFTKTSVFICNHKVIKDTVKRIFHEANENPLLLRPFQVLQAIRKVLTQKYSPIYIWDMITLRHLKTRKGECNLCGVCCGGCNHRRKDNKCDIWGKRSWCGIYFPISPWELENNKKKCKEMEKCSYWWD